MFLACVVTPAQSYAFENVVSVSQYIPLMLVITGRIMSSCISELVQPMMAVDGILPTRLSLLITVHRY